MSPIQGTIRLVNVDYHEGSTRWDVEEWTYWRNVGWSHLERFETEAAAREYMRRLTEKRPEPTKTVICEIPLV